MMRPTCVSGGIQPLRCGRRLARHRQDDLPRHVAHRHARSLGNDLQVDLLSRAHRADSTFTMYPTQDGILHVSTAQQRFDIKDFHPLKFMLE